VAVAETTATHTIDFVMPSLGADMERGRVGQWHLAAGATIRRGQVIVDVDTDKGLIDVECFHDGTLREILAAEGTEVPVGAVIARIEVMGAAAVAAAVAATAPPPPPPPSSSTPSSPVPEAAPATPAAIISTPSAPASGRVVATPLARRRARELGVDLARVTPGPAGRITAEDVARASSLPTSPPPPPASPTPKDPREAMRRAIAQSVGKSKREIPHYYLWHDVDVTDTLAWLTAENARRSLTDRLLFAAVLARAVAQTAKVFPELNGTFDDGVFSPSGSVHLGFATSLRGGGLIAPAILDAGDKDVTAMMVAITDLVARVRSSGLRGREMTAGTITLSSLGDTGVDGILPVIQWPQVAIVGAGRVTERAVVRHGQVVARSVITMSLAADHRVSDGARGARFLLALEKNLSTPPEQP
jgi:pyruvate dehydrogenase E2 component (dihydrolipoamide acetyltransferase)